MRFINIFAFLFVSLLFPIEASAATPISWDRAEVSHQSLVGTISTVEISFTSDRPLTNVEIRVVPELAPFVSVSPSSFDAVPAGQPQALTIFFTVPKGVSIQTLAGVIQIKKANKTIASPLSIQVKIRSATADDIPATLSQPSPDRITSSPESEQVVFVKDEISIYFKEGTPISEIKEFVSRIGGVILGSDPEVNFYQVQVVQEGFGELSAVIDQAALDPNILLALHHYFYKQTGIPLDPGSTESYAPRLISLPSAWDITIGRKAVEPNNLIELGIGVIDSAFAYLHADLRDNVIGVPNNNPGASLDHGTQVASIVGAKGNNGIDIAGVVWRSSLHLYSVGNAANTGLDGDLLGAALRRAIKERQRVVNMSFVFECSRSGCTNDELRKLFETSDFYRLHFDRAKNEGVDILWVCSAGNNGINHLFATPARLATSYSNVISVSAVNENRERAIFNSVQSSNYGESVSVGAPGINVPTLNPSGGYLNTFGGTSAAAPYVTGVGGLMLSVYPNLTAPQLKTIIKETADSSGKFDPDGNEIRILNAFRAVQQAQAKSTEFFSFFEGNPSIPGDGLFVSPTGGRSGIDHELLMPYPLRGTSDGLTFTLFLQPSIQNVSDFFFAVQTSDVNRSPRCTAGFGIGSASVRKVFFNGVQGFVFNYPQHNVEFLKLPDCALSIDDLRIESIQVSNSRGSRFALDAFVIRRGQDNFPGIPIP